ncbi:MAG: hypothetical protein HQ512_02470, partial [Rhodospirillales bacterium]|nr:hypothetical protein [Rhodospirillales bacterium]
AGAIHPICFGQTSFKKPEPIKKIQAPGFNAPDLAAELKAKAEGKDKKDAGATPRAVVVQDKFTSGVGLIFTVIVGAGLFLVVGGGIGYLIAKRRTDRRRKERRKRKDRRNSDQPIEGEDKRKAKDRRAKPERREDKDRRDES